MLNNQFICGRYRFNLNDAVRPLVMGILNVTPDSFFDGGRYFSLDSILDRAEKMIADGVDIIDIGGESTRPGAKQLSLNEELDRVMPVIYALKDCGKPLSIDTYKPQVMHHAVMAGVDMLNDVTGFGSQEALLLAAKNNCGLCVMHMQNQPHNMQQAPHYEDIVEEVFDFLHTRIQALIYAGVDVNRICVDPGFGFGKTFVHNTTIFKNIDVLKNRIKLPVLVGVSRKSMIGTIIDKPVEQRLAGSLSAALLAAMRGASIIRVHDVAETVDALAVLDALQ